jgi:hypothetical protein
MTQSKRPEPNGDAKINVCQPRPPENLGVVKHERDRAFAGLTLCWSRAARYERKSPAVTAVLGQ